MDNQDRAKQLLVHYLEMLMRKSGIEPTGNTRVEIEEIIDMIIEAAMERVDKRLVNYQLQIEDYDY